MNNGLLSALQSVGLGHPEALWLIALVVPLVIAVPRARLRKTPSALRIGVLVSRLTIGSLFVAALAAPTLRPIGHARAVVFAIDTSDSVTPDQRTWAHAWVERAVRALPPGSHADTIEFAERAQLAGAGEPMPAGSTDLAAALRLASALLAHDPRLSPQVVLLTDGWHTADSLPADGIGTGVAVSFVSLPAPASGPSRADRPVAVIHSLEVPSMSRVGDRIELSLELQSTQATDAYLRVWFDRTVIVNEAIHLEAGNAYVTLPQRVDLPGFIDVRAELRTGDATSRLSSVLVARPAARVLLLEDEPGQADGLAALLESEDILVERRPATSLPPSASALDSFDGAVLVNTPATNLTLDQQRTLVSFVQDLGRGLLVVGGPRAFSPGGYEGTVLDDALPVAAEPPIEPKQGSLALFLVIDRSGSMDIVSGGGSGGSGATKMAMAREAAMEAAGLLQLDDTLGVIAFDSSFKWVVPPTKLHTPVDAKRAQSLIATIKSGGGTSILPPLEAAFQAAAAADAPLKHIVLLTDGESSDHGYEDLIARMQPAHITLSTLAIGTDADTRLLFNLARIGGGRYYFTERSTQIPRIATKETTILTRNAVVEGAVAALVAEPSPILRSVSGDLPPLSGYVATTRKDRAVTALETERGHPLLAHWQYGLGRVVAWTSDAQQGWASDWANWSDAARFWSQAVRWSLPAPVRADFQPSVQLGADGRRVTLTLQTLRADGHFADLVTDTRATVVGPDGAAREVMLRQRGPGVYGVESRVTAPGTYRVLFKQGPREDVAAFSAPDSVELHSVGTNRALLDQLARATGGRELSDATDLSAPANGPGPAVDLWPWLAAVALLLLPLDVFLRRLA